MDEDLGNSISDISSTASNFSLDLSLQNINFSLHKKENRNGKILMHLLNYWLL